MNGYVTLQESVLQSSQNQPISMNESVQKFSKNLTGFVNCNEGYILDNPNQTQLSCYNGLWGLQNKAIDVSDYERKTVKEGLPNCREIVCKPKPFIPNSRLLKQVSSHKDDY